MIAALVLSVLSLAGCSRAEPATKASETKAYYVDVGFRAYEFRLDDGTRCVALYRGGIDCDWARK